MNIAVTGATGQIGVTLCRELLRAGHSLNVLYHNSKLGLEDLPISWYKGDVTDLESLRKCFAGCDYVFHLAAIVSLQGDPDGRVFRTNVEGTRNIAEICMELHVKRLIHFSSVHAYKAFPHDKEMTENNAFADHLNFVYERTKSTAQQYLMNLARENKLNVIILNPTAVIGPQDYLPSIKGKMLIDLYNRKIPAILPGGFDWVDTRDVVNAALNAMEMGRSGESYLLSGQYYSVADFVIEAEKVTGKKAPRLILPIGLIRALIPLLGIWAKLSKTEPLFTEESITTLVEGNPKVSHKKAEAELGYTSRPLQITLRDSYDWFCQNGYIN